ncbi:helix-hairpin-helix domain-containing protein [Weissella kandleri]|uniref:helix-hairpin-helix domain-containing protein n=1 Tax=Weissella kandleri TaxID=1616 RepID=UPI00387E65D3
MQWIKQKRLLIGILVILMLSSGIFLAVQGSRQQATVPVLDQKAMLVSEQGTLEQSSLGAATAKADERLWRIDVKGGVQSPDVYIFKTQPVVKDVLRRAGGPLDEVDLKRLNLAAPVANGQVVYVPLGDEAVPTEYPLPGFNIEGTLPKSEMRNAEHNQININQATQAELEKLPGIGAKRAQDITTFRQSHGLFRQVDDLKNIAGIGEKTLEKLKGSITL